MQSVKLDTMGFSVSIGGLHLLMILASVFGSSLGQVLLKQGAVSIGPLNTLTDVLWLATNVRLILGLAMLVLCTVMWIAVLRTIPLTIGYPFTALAFVFVPILSALMIGEALSINTFVGAAFIFFGIIVSVQ